MNRDDIIREMGWLVPELVESELLNRIERTVRLAEAAEREACAKECETLLPSQRIYDRRFYDAVGECVATIRATDRAPLVSGDVVARLDLSVGSQCMGSEARFELATFRL